MRAKVHCIQNCSQYFEQQIYFLYSSKKKANHVSNGSGKHVFQWQSVPMTSSGVSKKKTLTCGHCWTGGHCWELAFNMLLFCCCHITVPGADLCLGNPCRNRGTCFVSYHSGSTSVFYTPQYICLCANGFTGTDCQLLGRYQAFCLFL